jgi:hypothetical protein
MATRMGRPSFSLWINRWNVIKFLHSGHEDILKKHLD